MNQRAPVLIICHGAGEFKENYFELCELLAGRGVATLAIDMHGHGQSAGERFYVTMRQWVADVQAAIDFLLTHPKIDGKKIGAFGLSSGGTAILEAAVICGADVQKTASYYSGQRACRPPGPPQGQSIFIDCGLGFRKPSLASIAHSS